MNVDELAKIFEESMKHNKNPYAIALDHFKKELVKKMNDLLDGSIKCNEQYSSYAAALILVNGYNDLFTTMEFTL